jgi:hypothetical protein
LAQTIYRIVHSNAPSDADYLTYEQLGKTSDLHSDMHVRMAQGYSCFVSFTKARSRAKGLPWRGNAFIATYLLEDGVDFELQQTGRRLSHYTLWCDASVLKQALQSVVPVRESDDSV